MTIEICEKTKLRQIQKQFRKAYPFLKILFSDKPHEFGSLAPGGHWQNANYRLEAISGSFRSGCVEIHPWHKTGDAEKILHDYLGLYPQIFRTNGFQWIETSGTDVLTLEEQNEIGKKCIEKLSGVGEIEHEHLL